MDKKHLIILIAALLCFCAGATAFNMILTPAGRSHGGDSVATRLEVRMREFFAEFLWNRVDVYHHMWEFSEKSPSQERSSIYLMKYAVEIDPHFEKAYSVGAFMLYDQWGKEREGRKFLMEGIRNNPQSWMLWRDLTLYSFFQQQDLKLTVSTGKRAVKYIGGQDTSNPDYITFIRIMASSFFKLEIYDEAHRYYLILEEMGLLNPNDRKNIEIIKEVFDAR